MGIGQAEVLSLPIISVGQPASGVNLTSFHEILIGDTVQIIPAVGNARILLALVGQEGHGNIIHKIGQKTCPLREEVAVHVERLSCKIDNSLIVGHRRQLALVIGRGDEFHSIKIDPTCHILPICGALFQPQGIIQLPLTVQVYEDPCMTLHIEQFHVTATHISPPAVTEDSRYTEAAEQGLDQEGIAQTVALSAVEGVGSIGRGLYLIADIPCHPGRDRICHLLGGVAVLGDDPCQIQENLTVCLCAVV